MSDGTLLVTGGAGYIGSHIVVQLLQAGHHVVVFDNLVNSNERVFDRIEAITGKRPDFIHGDIRDASALRAVFEANKVNAVIHMAGLKSVSEGESDPLRYYDNNVAGSLCLFHEMHRAGVQQLVFSSSATVYGNQGLASYGEDAALQPVSVYGRSKAMVEELLDDWARSEPGLRVAILRYFNPVGAHESGLIGEDPRDVPNNLMPYITQVAIGRHPILSVFGNDYDTPDGTGLRDYIHVDDLAAGHLAALDALKAGRIKGALAINLGTGRPYSVLELVRAFEAASGQPVPYQIVERRPGDVAQSCADPSRALAVLDWQAQHGIDRMCADAWRWQSRNPEGYR